MEHKRKGKILIIDDEADIRFATKIVLDKYFEQVHVASSPQEGLPFVNEIDVVLLDMNFSAGSITGREGIEGLQEILLRNPACRVIMMTAYGSIKLAVKAMQLGAFDFIVKPWDNSEVLQKIRKALNSMPQPSQPTGGISQAGDLFLSASQAMKPILKTIKKVAQTDANVLIMGENGTGKDLVAQELHRHSARKNKQFISVDLGALSENLFDSELFGHVKGAFTDAKTDRTGRFREASAGTLFLDEIGNLTPALQTKLLRVLQERKISPVGSNREIPVDVRLICATNQRLSKKAKNQNFRQDLLYRINTVELFLPPLRERHEDILLLAEHFLKKFKTKYQKNNIKFSAKAQKALQTYHFPGNVRELQHLVERGVIMCENKNISPDDLNFQHQSKGKRGSIEQTEKKAIRKALERSSGNISQAAQTLGLGRTTLYRKIKKYGL